MSKKLGAYHCELPFQGEISKKILFERETWMPNWLFNREVIGNRRAAKDGFTATHRSSDM
ncbi:hypothetical protein TUM4438_31940 [Shewanella sairae]|uniref:Uncharacterized protein n=1 Tax=Shewanella sairae TaxID=190310 RepID=A0ABQ4PM42_9GAMM|nr:hypothetical protein TUM4438_31940 [Shewanella sairae]